MNTYKKIILFIPFILACLTASTQEGFGLSLVGGFNASQIAGDALSGFDKFGLHGGLKIGYKVKPKLDVFGEFIYTQKGSQAQVTQALQKTGLDYLELPVYLTLYDWYQESNNFYKVSIHAGFSYAYLLRIKTLVNTFSQDLENFKNWDMAFLIGASYHFTQKIGMTVRYTNSFIRIYKNDALTTSGLINYLWTFRMEYKF